MEPNGSLGERGPEIILKFWVKPTAGKCSIKEVLDLINELSGSLISQAPWRPGLATRIQDQPSNFANSIFKPLKRDHEFANPPVDFGFIKHECGSAIARTG